MNKVNMVEHTKENIIETLKNIAISFLGGLEATIVAWMSTSFPLILKNDSDPIVYFCAFMAFVGLIGIIISILCLTIFIFILVAQFNQIIYFIIRD